MREGIRIRSIHFGVALLAALIAAISPAAASSLTIGLPANNGTSITSEQIGGYACQPFGCPADVMNDGITSLLSWSPEYQQVYAKTSFTLGSYTLTGISFPVSGPHHNGGTFQISLSTTSAPVLNAGNIGTGLNRTNLSANLGADNTVVYVGPLPAISGGMLTITFTTPFAYTPSSGNLLLDVQSSNATNSLPYMFVTLGYKQGTFSRIWAGLGEFDDHHVDGFGRFWYPGLVTTFLF
jgi:hypothetical protein